MKKMIFFLLYFLVSCTNSTNSTNSASPSYDSRGNICFSSSQALSKFYDRQLKKMELNTYLLNNISNSKVNSDYYFGDDGNFPPNSFYLVDKKTNNFLKRLVVYRDFEDLESPILIDYGFNSSEKIIEKKDLIMINYISELVGVPQDSLHNTMIKYFSYLEKNKTEDEIINEENVINNLVFEFCTDPNERNISFMYVYAK